MEETGERNLTTSATALEDATDATLSRLLGGTLQAATMRIVLYLAILCVVAATIGSLV
jgi:hypothetical protein